MKKKQDKLVAIYSSLNQQHREMLLEFAEFLAARHEPIQTELPEPKQLPRPEGESVVGAIRRLSETYFMLDKKNILTDASGLMAQHIMQGRDAAEVIDELEQMFEQYYDKTREEFNA